MKPMYLLNGKKTTEKHIGNLVGCESRDWCLKEAHKLHSLYRITRTDWVADDGTKWSIQLKLQLSNQGGLA